MDKSPQNLMMIGLPESGKSSFLHAIDEALQHPLTDDALRATGLAHDRSYLEAERALYRAGKEFERTKRNLKGAIPELWFSDPRDGREGRLFVPDVSGEVYRDQWVLRVWEQSYADNLKNTSGILLFGRADLAPSNQELLGKLIAPDAPPGSSKDWKPREASTQVQLVDILQFIAMRADLPRPLRIAMMLSAWDAINKPGEPEKSPEQLFRKDWSMLAQFFETNSDIFTLRIYGVSARGGTYEELKGMLQTPPWERVQIVDGESISRDLTRPLRWLMQES